MVWNAPVAQRKAVSVAVIIAIDNVPGFPPLAGAADAVLLATHLRHIGYTEVSVLTWPPRPVTAINASSTTAIPEVIKRRSIGAFGESSLDTSRQALEPRGKGVKLTRNKIVERLQEARSELVRGDFMFVFVAGHGGIVTVGAREQAAVFPAEYNPANPLSALLLDDIKRTVCDQDPSSTGGVEVVLLYDICSDIPLWPEELLQNPQSLPEGLAIVAPLFKPPPTELAQSLLVNVFLTALEDARAAHSGKPLLCDVFLGMKKDLAERDLDMALLLLTDAGSTSAGVVLSVSAVELEYLFTLVCSVPVTATTEKHYVEQRLPVIQAVLGCSELQGFVVSVDVIISVLPLGLDFTTEQLDRSAAAFTKFCRSFGIEVPQLKRTRKCSEWITDENAPPFEFGTSGSPMGSPRSPTSFMASLDFGPREVVELFMSVALDAFEALRDHILLEDSDHWFECFAPHFKPVSVRSTFQVQGCGPLRSYLMAQASMMAAMPIDDVFFEKQWLRSSRQIAERQSNPNTPAVQVAESRPVKAQPSEENKDFPPETPEREKPDRAADDFVDGTLVHELKQHWYWVSCLGFSPDDSLLASGSWDKTAIVWNAATGAPLCSFQDEHEHWITAVEFCGTLLQTRSGGQGLRTMLHRTIDKLGTSMGGASGRLNSTLGEGVPLLRISAEDPTESSFGPSVIGDLDASRMHRPSRAIQSQVSPLSGITVATAGLDGRIILWDCGTQRPIRTMSAHTKGVRALSYDRKSEFLASAGEDKLVKLWDLKTGECNAVLEGHKGSVCCVSFSHAAGILCSGSNDNTVIVWQVKAASTGHESKTSLEASDDSLHTAASALRPRSLSAHNPRHVPIRHSMRLRPSTLAALPSSPSLLTASRVMSIVSDSPEDRRVCLQN
eukprot:TRINITY_DN15848_c0_g1_i1.p1 TRINITY_DN15848_c0_g1~~TRINITY_DN15848_c0_g1_i1.p1  ORF type:complete len:895 (+),score=106.21 TRINITY_DN15848_c0_g1_i1:50-2734(+)